MTTRCPSHPWNPPARGGCPECHIAATVAAAVERDRARENALARTGRRVPFVDRTVVRDRAPRELLAVLGAER